MIKYLISLKNTSNDLIAELDKDTIGLKEEKENYLLMCFLMISNTELPIKLFKKHAR